MAPRFAGIAAVFLLASCLTHASDSVDRVSVDRARALTLEGLRLLYNFDIDRARQKFDEAIAVEPRHPRPHLSRALAPLWKSFASRTPEDYAEALRFMDRTIEISEKYLEEVDDRDPDALMCLASGYGYRAYIHVVNKSYLKGTWDAKRCYDHLTDVVSADPKFYDAYFGLGLYHFAVATVPRALRWIIGILGVEGDRDRGMKEIELAARKGTYNVADAKFFLAQFYPWYKGDFDASEKLVDELLRSYPGNTVFIYAKGFLKLRQNKITEAIPHFLRMKELGNRHFAIINKFAEFRLGDCYFRLGEYPHALDAYRAFLEMNNKGQFEAMASYQAGLASEMLGDREGALKLYRRARDFDGGHGDDVYSARQAARRLASPLTLVDRLMIAARNYHRRELYSHAVESYTDVLHGYSLTSDQRAEALYRLGESLFESGRLDEAEEQFQTVVGLPVSSEQWVMPWAHFMLGQIAMKNGDRLAAKREFEAVGEYESYDHKNWLTFRTEQELDKLRKSAEAP